MADVIITLTLEGVEMATITIDDTLYEVADGANILEAVLSLGLDLPYFCWHPALGSVGSCRQCAVLQFQNEEDERGRIVMGCMTAVSDGMLLSLSNDKAVDFRADVIESLMTNHPHDCPVCAEGGECHLQDMTVMSGHRNRRYDGLKNTHVNQDLGPLINHEMNRCIACYRCTRYYRDYAGGTDLAAMGSHDHVYFGRHEDGTLESEFAGNLVEVCPTGVFTDKALVNDYTRKWDLQSAPSICVGCAVGCNIAPGERYGRLKRIHNRYNHEVNGYFLCDRGRFGGSFVNSDKRLLSAGWKLDDDVFSPLNSEQALAQLQTLCLSGDGLYAIGSPRASLESNWMLRTLVGRDKFCSGFGAEDAALRATVSAIVEGGVHTATLPEVEAADLVIILGEDVTQTAPRLALALRQTVRNVGLEQAATMGVQYWQDTAVRNIAQNTRTPLIELVTASTRLADIASDTVTFAPADIARVGFALAHALGAGPEVDGLSSTDIALVARLQALVDNAERPLIISGCSSHNVSVVAAAQSVAAAVAQKHASTRVVYVAPEANSVGLGLLDPNALSLEEIGAAARNGEIKTLVVLENDLYRRAPKAQVDALLGSVANLVVLDTMEHLTAEAAQLVLPVASYAECEGTLVNNEGRAQRFYPPITASEDRPPAWHWLRSLAGAMKHSSLAELTQIDDVIDAIATDVPLLAGVIDASPKASYRDRVGLKAARQPHRYSGRTAMYANKTLHEPKTQADDDSALAYSMEGESQSLPGALRSFVWDPGWNSNQSLHKFQDEIGGSLKGGSSGARLINATGHPVSGRSDVPDAFERRQGSWCLTPQYRLYGSDEMSAYATPVAEMMTGAPITLSPADVESLALGAEDGVSIVIDELSVDCAVIIDPLLPAGTAGFVVGHPEMLNLRAGSYVALEKKPDFMRVPEVIVTDGVRAHG